MKKLLLCLTVFALAASSAFALDFAPEPMVLSAPSNIFYEFDGNNLQVPLNVAGVPGVASFMVFTKDKGESIGEVTNGYLGWHYVNKIDTCVYMSTFAEISKGANTITWNGKDNDGGMVPAGDYTYYVWAFDNATQRQQVTRQISIDPWIYRTIVTHDVNGSPLDRPMVYIGGGTRGKLVDRQVQTHRKWTIGSDPEDASLLETSTTMGWCGVGGLALLPTDRNFFFYDTLRDNGYKITEKYQWVPNGESVLQADWGEDGQYSYTTDTFTAGNNFGWGVVSDGGDYLMLANADLLGNGTVSQIIYIDAEDGSEVRRVDMAEWWVSMSDKDAGGQSDSGPTEMNLRNGMAFLGAHSSCLNQMIDPFAEDDTEVVKWSNANGDMTGDHNFEPESGRPWVCNDYNVGPYKYNISADANLFSVFPSYDLGAVSFGLYAPDGTGMGYHMLAGETAYQKYGIEFIDYGSAYDGIYTTNNMGSSADSKGIDKTWWYVGHDSIKGTITNQVGVADAAPAAFTVAQNVPNPFNPTTTISFTLAQAGMTTVEVYNVAGQKIDTLVNSSLKAGSHSVTWNAASFSAGVYFYTVKSGSFSKTTKMTLLK